MPGRKRKQEDTTDSGTTASVPAKDPAKMTVAELKKELQDRGLDTSGKKVELVARLEGATSSSKGGTDSTDAGEPPSAKKQKTSSGTIRVWLLFMLFTPEHQPEGMCWSRSAYENGTIFLFLK